LIGLILWLMLHHCISH